MSIRIKHCLIIACDVCNTIADSEDWGTPHFETLDEAVEHLHESDPDSNGWLMTPTEHVCPACRAKRTCSLVGHDWSDWFEGDARGIRMMRRWCYRCSANEVAMPGEVAP